MTKLKQAREKAGMTQEQAAEDVGVSLGVWRHYEQGSRRFDGAGLATILKAAIVLKCRVEDVIESAEIIGLIAQYRQTSETVL